MLTAAKTYFVQFHSSLLQFTCASIAFVIGVHGSLGLCICICECDMDFVIVDFVISLVKAGFFLIYRKKYFSNYFSPA